MGADPLAAVRALGGAIYYVHAKDTRIEPIPAGIDGVLETRPASEVASRSWNYVTLRLRTWRGMVAPVLHGAADGRLR